MILRKKEVYTVVTPIPGFIPRQLALDILHSHSEMITLNPLVLSHRQIQPPRNAVADEYFSTWYEITERVQYIPGLGRLGSGIISFNGCFHDLPWGLQTHTYAPAGVDLRVRYRIGGNQPGFEPPDPQPELELGPLGAPRNGLYLREDIEIRCNIAMVGLVKSQMKTASKEMVARIIKKAELLDAGILRAMFENGRIRTLDPLNRTTTATTTTMSPPGSPYTPPLSPSVPYQIPRPISQQPQSRPGTPSSNLQYPVYGGSYSNSNSKTSQDVMELSNTEAPKPQQGPVGVVMELPGDYHHASPHLQPVPLQPKPLSINRSKDRTSTVSNVSHSSSERNSGWRWSGGGGGGQRGSSLISSRPTSYSSDAGSGVGGGGFASPGLDFKGFSAELPIHPETQEEHHPETQEEHHDPPPQPLPPQYRPYNPADYARLGR